MTQDATNPFVGRRWEFETDHVMWVPAQAKKVLGQSPCHIQGVRGSGKTALLRLSEYYTRRSRRMQVYNSSAIVDRCLGVYVNFLDEFTEYFDINENPEYYYNYTILYCYAKVFDLIDDANRDGVLDVSLKQERDYVRRLVSRFEISSSKYEDIETFSSLASILRRHCKSLRDGALTSTLSTAALASAISGLEFADWVCANLRDTDILYSKGTSFFIKISVDDAHLANEDSQKRLNNILYRSQAPIFWNIAYVEGQFDPFNIDSRIKYITAHDREFVDLNYRDDSREFSAMCEKIFELRVAKNLLHSERATQSMSDLRSYIGRPSFEVMFERMIARSGKQQIIASLERYRREIGKKLEISSQDVKSYQGFLALCIFPSLEELRTFLANRSKEQIDNYFRQKGGAALVVGARRLELSVPYEGFNTMLYLADGCLRDFLSLCSELYELDKERSEPKRAFFSGTLLPTELQTRAFRSYARKYAAGLHDPRQPYSRQLSRLVQGLGQLNYLLQTEDPRVACLMPDRGLFRIDFEPGQRSLFVEENKEYEGVLREIVKEAVYTGAVRIENGSIIAGTTVEVRLAGILAPARQLAPRKPVRSVTISYLQLSDLIATNGGTEPDAWALRMYGQFGDLLTKEISEELSNPRML